MKSNDFSLASNNYNQNIFDLIPSSEVENICLELDVKSLINFNTANEPIPKIDLAKKR
jgi:hypothetical protein